MHISIMLVFWSCSLILLVRNSVVLAVYLLFSVACFFTVHEHLRTEVHLSTEVPSPTGSPRQEPAPVIFLLFSIQIFSCRIYPCMAFFPGRIDLHGTIICLFPQHTYSVINYPCFIYSPSAALPCPNDTSLYI